MPAPSLTTRHEEVPVWLAVMRTVGEFFVNRSKVGLAPI